MVFLTTFLVGAVVGFLAFCIGFIIGTKITFSWSFKKDSLIVDHETVDNFIAKKPISEFDQFKEWQKESKKKRIV